MLRVNWTSFGQAIRCSAVAKASYLDQARQPLGVDHARMVNAAQGKPVGTEIFLTLCDWMEIDPMYFTVPIEDQTHDH